MSLHEKHIVLHAERMMAFLPFGLVMGMPVIVSLVLQTPFKHSAFLVLMMMVRHNLTQHQHQH